MPKNRPDTVLVGGVQKTHIVDGRLKHAVLLEIFTREGVLVASVAQEGLIRVREPRP